MDEYFSTASVSLKMKPEIPNGSSKSFPTSGVTILSFYFNDMMIRNNNYALNGKLRLNQWRHLLIVDVSLVIMIN